MNTATVEAPKTISAGDGFTEKYFLEEICRFRQLFGNKDWWTKTDEQREQCIRALGLLYLKINNDDGTAPNHEQLCRWADIFHNTVGEYEHRKMMLISMGRLAA